MTKIFYLIIFILIGISGLASCGQKGPLYLPEAEKGPQKFNHRANQ